MPYDWLFEVEAILIRLIPAYTLEKLDDCDIDRILPYYFFDYRKALSAKKQAENKATDFAETDDENIVVRNGKKYRKITAEQATWVDNIF